ncbi:MAG: DUF2092 domain-containing protein [Dechloromonas sp.]|nr:DUF2092 domain-containing protein [Dechloromonas sp.]
MNHFIRQTGIAMALSLLVVNGASAQTAPAGAKPTKSAVKKPAAPVDKPALETRAVDLLKATSSRLAAAKAMSFTATVSYEHPSRLGPPLVFTSRYDVVMQRPEKLRVINLGDGPASEFYLDGKTMLAYAPAENLIAIAEAPPTLEAALKMAFNKAAIYFPFTDLLLPDPFAAIADGTKLAFYVGPSGLVGGVKTDMVAWANDDVFMQMWVGADDKLPRRIRAVFRADPLRLRHDMELSNWQIDPVIAADVFGTSKAKDAQRIDFAHPAAKLPPGVKPVAKSLKPASKSQ